MSNDGDRPLDAIAQTAVRLEDTDYASAVLDALGDARIVMLGEASHGTHEFYAARADITRRLIQERGFDAIAVEADWPDALRVSRYVRCQGDDANPNQALGDFERFPRWMWRNTDVVDLVGWLRAHNEREEPAARVGFYGLDLYSLHSSMTSVLEYLERVDPDAAERARYRYSCFDHFGEDPQSYGYAANFGMTQSCEQGVIAQLLELRQKAFDYARRDGRLAEDEFFFAEQNARVAVEAEKYYRTMFSGRVSSWNVRDRHMTDTLIALDQHISRQRGRPARIVVWEHNSHLGDARATQMGDEGEWNVGQLVREHWGGDAFNLGFTTYSGTVTAASDWDGPAERKRVRPALPGSVEALMHDADVPRFLLDLRLPQLARALFERMLERAIGVIYMPRTERMSHYFYVDLPRQFNALIHVDETRALEPLERNAGWEAGELPETYPSGL